MGSQRLGTARQRYDDRQQRARQGGRPAVTNENTVTVYAAGDTGNATPIATLGTLNTPTLYSAFTSFITF